MLVCVYIIIYVPPFYIVLIASNYSKKSFNELMKCAFYPRLGVGVRVSQTNIPFTVDECTACNRVKLESGLIDPLQSTRWHLMSRPADVAKLVGS